MSLDSMTPAEMKEQELKERARWAADDIIRAEGHKKNKEIKKHLKAEFKDRENALKAAMGEKKEKPKKKNEAPAKKSTAKKKK